MRLPARVVGKCVEDSERRRRETDGEPRRRGGFLLDDDNHSTARYQVEQVEVVLPHPILERGITLIDTPGIGGLNAAHAAATLAFLPIADALVFVSDASAELTGPELEFLRSAVDAGPLIVVALTKVDIYPSGGGSSPSTSGACATSGSASARTR